MKNTKMIVLNGIIAAIYAVFTLMISPIAYGNVQMRLSEILIFLAFYNKKYIPGLTIGCLIANLFSPLGMYDIGFGVSATLIALIGMYLVNNKYIAAMIASLANGILVGIELHIVYQIPFLINAAYVFIGELIVLIIGAILFNQLEKNQSFMNMLELNEKD